VLGLLVLSLVEQSITEARGEGIRVILIKVSIVDGILDFGSLQL
jgi:hypothetical protein